MQVGDWAVIKDRYDGVFAREVTRCSQKTFHAGTKYSNREHRYSSDAALYVGTQDAATKVAERLVSSKALYDDDCRRAYERKQKRDAEIIGKDDEAKKAYEASTDDPVIHCNRFPAWSELSDSERDEWRRRVTDHR